MPNIGPVELIVVLVIALLVLGPRRLPTAGRSLGQGIREFKESLVGPTERPARAEDASRNSDDGWHEATATSRVEP